MTTPPRKGHVKRIYPDPTDQSVWYDVLRFDKLPLDVKGVGTGARYTVVNQPQWLDKDKENNNPARKMVQIDLVNPQNTDQTQKAWAINQMAWSARGDGDGDTHQTVKWNFDNNSPDDQVNNPSDPVNTRRTGKAVRVCNNDLNGLDMSQNVDWDDYLVAMNAGTQDKTDYIDFEIPQKFTVNNRPGFLYQDQVFALNNDPLIKLFDPTPDSVDPKNVSRLDPMQVIVNISWGGYLMFVRFDWADEYVSTLDPSTNQTSFVINPVTVSVVPDAATLKKAAYKKLAVSIVTGLPDHEPGEIEGPLSQNQYSQTFVLKIGGVPDVTAKKPIQVVFNITGQSDYEDYVFSTVPSGGNLVGMTKVTGGKIVEGGRWVGVETIVLYPTKDYKLDITNALNPVQLKDPKQNPPGKDYTLSFNTTQYFTIPESDTYYYSSSAPGTAVLTGGAYSTSGLFKGGVLNLNIEQYPIVGNSPQLKIPVMWPSVPAVKTVEDVAFYSPLVFTGGGVGMPNPPPSFTFGLYTVKPNPNQTNGVDHTVPVPYYPFGVAPTLSHTYVGEYPLSTSI